MTDPHYIIIQASGLGSRMGHLTNNRPKILVSVDGQPLIFRLMKLYPKSKFIIIGYYKFNVLKKYINKYSPTKNFQIIKSTGAVIGNNSGISHALKYIPKGHSLMILWSDLFHNEKLDFSNLDKTNNYIGLSGNFYCRWSFKNHQLAEKRSKIYGVAGVYIFKDKKQIRDVPRTGEFCEYLRKKGISFKPIKLSDKIIEVGTLKKYFQIIKSFPVSRPFNKIVVKKNTVTKLPQDKQGITLGVIESNWYKEFFDNHWNFLPNIISHDPLVMEKINGRPIFHYKFSRSEKKHNLKIIVDNLKKIHSSKKAIQSNYYNNNVEAYLKKLKIDLTLYPIWFHLSKKNSFLLTVKNTKIHI